MIVRYKQSLPRQFDTLTGHFGSHLPTTVETTLSR